MPTEPPKVAPALSPQLHRLLETLAPAGGGRSRDVSGIDPASPVSVAPCSTVIGAVPFSGSVQARSQASEAGTLARSRRADLIAIAWALLALEPGGRLALIVPESFLHGATQAHQAMRRRLIEENALLAVIRLRAGVYKARTRAAVVVAQKGGETGRVWFCELNAARDMATLLVRWSEHERGQRGSPGDLDSVLVPREEFEPPAYRLDIEHAAAARPDEAGERAAHEILHEIAGLEADILQGIRDLAGLLK
jgi:type I restriction enzyme M protein